MYPQSNGFQYNDTLYRLVRLRNNELSKQLHDTTFVHKESMDYSVGSRVVLFFFLKS